MLSHGTEHAGIPVDHHFTVLNFPLTVTGNCVEEFFLFFIIVIVDDSLLLHSK